MDFSKMKKEELLVEVQKLQTLPSVIDAKNKEISQLKSEKEEIRIEASKVRGLEITSKNLDEENKVLKDLLEKANKQLVDQKNAAVLKEENTFLKAEAERVVKLANMYILSFRNYLQLQEGALSNMKEMELMLQEKLK
jgi:hypothetical protein